jgi:hypothetical protein
MPAPRKRQPARGKQKVSKPASKIDWAGHWLKLAGDPQLALPTDNCPEKVLGCIRRQSGGQDLSSNPKIGDIGVDGFLLAGCINEQLGRNYTGADFPASMRVMDVIHKVCGNQ